MSITFYATIDASSVRDYMPDVPALLPASSWARLGVPLPCPRLPAHVRTRAADCGGFVATRIWGDYRYTPAQYVDWLSTWQPQWAATFDYCCEDEITSGRPGVVRERQARTTAMAWYFWQTYPDVPWAWVPTVQGWQVADYECHVGELVPLIREMARTYGPQSAFRVGIGTLCRRASTDLIRAVAETVAHILPGIPLHLWGIKLHTLKSPLALPHEVCSVDSAAWHGLFGSQCKVWKHSGYSKRRYSYEVALPAYLKKVEAALAQPKQPTLWQQDKEVNA